MPPNEYMERLIERIDNTIGIFKEFRSEVNQHFKSLEIKQERTNEKIENLANEHSITKQEIAVLKVKSGVWGTIGGTIVVLTALLVKLLFPGS